MLCSVFYSMHGEKHVSDDIFMFFFFCFFWRAAKTSKGDSAVEGEETSWPLLPVDLSRCALWQRQKEIEKAGRK